MKLPNPSRSRQADLPVALIAYQEQSQVLPYSISIQQTSSSTNSTSRKMASNQEFPELPSVIRAPSNRFRQAPTKLISSDPSKWGRQEEDAQQSGGVYKDKKKNVKVLMKWG